jgi:RNA polymerase sigma-32 factor
MTANALVARYSDLALTGPLGSFDAYLDRVTRIPVLSREDEQALAQRFRDHGDLDAARTLVLSQLRFVVHIARGYLGYGLPLGDLVQEGNIGLMKAVKRFDPDMGVRLVSFAVHWIRAEIHEYVLRNWRLVKVATTKAQRKLFFNLRRAKRHLGWLSGDEREAIARDLGVTAREVTEMEQRLAGRDVTFDPVARERGRRSPGGAGHLPPEPGADPAEALEAEIDWQDHRRRPAAHGARWMASIDRSRAILEARWLGDGKATLQELADRYGVSAERIRQIEANAHDARARR